MQDQMSTKLEQIPSSCNRNSSTCFTLQILKNPNFEQKKRNQSSKTEAQVLKPSTVKKNANFFSSHPKAKAHPTKLHLWLSRPQSTQIRFLCQEIQVNQRKTKSTPALQNRGGERKRIE